MGLVFISTVILVLAYFLTPIDTSTATLAPTPTSGTGCGVLGETPVEPMEKTFLTVGRDRSIHNCSTDINNLSLQLCCLLFM